MVTAEREKTLPSLSVLMVTYNSALHLRPTLEALLAQDYPLWDVTLVDNASRDDSVAIARELAEQHARLRVIAGETNRGFAGGNNDAVDASGGDVILLLNPDAILPPGALRRLAAVLSGRADAGIVGAKLVESDGDRILECGAHMPIPGHGEPIARGERDGPDWNTTTEVEMVSGAVLAIPRAHWRRLRGFDEYFHPAYYEDADLCLRCRRLGKKVLCIGDVAVRHVEKVSVTHHSPSFYWMHHKGRLWFMAKNIAPADLLRWLPAEWRWYRDHATEEVREIIGPLYGMTLRRFFKRRLLRLAPLHERASPPRP